MTYFVTTGHPLGKYRYSVPTGYSRYGSYSSRLYDPSKGYSSYTSPYASKYSYSSPYVSRSTYSSPLASKYSSYKPTSYSRPSYLTNSKIWSNPRKPSLTYSEPRSTYSRTIKPLSSTVDYDYSYLKKGSPIDIPRLPKSNYSNYSSNRQLIRPKMMPLSDVSFKYTVSRYRGHLNDYLSWR
ncbi:unnamed protein product [Meganyctiphanes norvegica]|uniref:Uncharacterized protein n=1 Tax=Meganyctiphanes norvegica TaxID=48144 RepID=A0AAV2Q5D3_MEGNR